ncbi:MAG: diaminopimelate epimerase, partial [Pseudonocardia sp.]|nr:diaminopimelate epimerase [Pseudonocardia sp.]
MQFSKGHGTENDFVLLPDPDGALDLTAARVTALCDRRRGLGADGVLRVVRWAALADGPAPEPGVEWFMDYRNADGSVAEMCGNGVRVYARYLAHRGWLGSGE